MNSFTIAQQLWLEETIMGATLNYQTHEDGRDILFRVGISHRSLEECEKSLTSKACLWTIKDGSLTIFGDAEELSLTFCTVQGRFVQAGVSLHGEALRLFKYALHALLMTKRFSLN